jgi:hypothetical protein
MSCRQPRPHFIVIHQRHRRITLAHVPFIFSADHPCDEKLDRHEPMLPQRLQSVLDYIPASIVESDYRLSPGVCGVRHIVERPVFNSCHTQRSELLIEFSGTDPQKRIARPVSSRPEAVIAKHRHPFCKQPPLRPAEKYPL